MGARSPAVANQGIESQQLPCTGEYQLWEREMQAEWLIELPSPDGEQGSRMLTIERPGELRMATSILAEV